MTNPVLYQPISTPPPKRDEILRYLGYGENQPDFATEQLLEQCISKLMQTAVPRAVYTVLPLKIQEDGIFLGESNLFIPGKQLSFHLDGCQTAVLMGATLSAQTDRLIRTEQIADMTRGVLMDSCATAFIEQLCDQTEIQIHSHIENHISSLFSVTSRYSPGYGDVPLSAQHDLLTLLDVPRKIGLCATESCMLTPRKSVTAILGIAQRKIERTPSGIGCTHCSLKATCTYKKDRKDDTCGFSHPL